MYAARHLIIGLSACLMLASAAWGDESSETFVRDNATQVLQALDDPALNTTERTEKFNEYMNQFSNLNRISSFVIGKYSRRFSDEDKARYRTAFRQYSLAAYEAQFDQYRGSRIEVTGSIDRNEKDSIVKSIIHASDGDDLKLNWRVLTRNDRHEVVDIGLDVEGDVLWLAIEQRAQFLDLLDRNNGSADALIRKLGELTRDLKDR